MIHGLCSFSVKENMIRWWKKTSAKAPVAQCYIEPDPKRMAGKKGDGSCDFMYRFSLSPGKIMQVSHEPDGVALGILLLTW